MPERGREQDAAVAPLWGELRYGSELARLIAARALAAPALLRRRPADAPPVLLIPGFMAGDHSLAVMRSWLRGRGHPVATSGMRLNAGCAEQIVSRLQRRLRRFAERSGRPVVLIGQSRGGALARALAVREPDSVTGLLMLGSPVCDGLAVAPPVLATVKLMARIGDLGVGRVFSNGCAEGDCCEGFRADMQAPLPEHLTAISVFSRSDGIVDWHACLDPHARHVEVDSSHCGMSVHPAVYRVIEDALKDSREAAWTG